MGITRKPADKPEPAVKAERKKPVRRSPALKDYPNKLAWLKAMTDYEEAQTTVTSEAKVARLDKRIAAKITAIDTLAEEIEVLKAERFALLPSPVFTEAQAEPQAEPQPPTEAGERGV